MRVAQVARQRAPRRAANVAEAVVAAFQRGADFHAQRPRHAIRYARGMAPAAGLRVALHGQRLSAQHRLRRARLPLEAIADHVHRVRGQRAPHAGQRHSQPPLPRPRRVVVFDRPGRRGRRQFREDVARQRRRHRERLGRLDPRVVESPRPQRARGRPRRQRQRPRGFRDVIGARGRAARAPRTPRQRHIGRHGPRQRHRELHRGAFLPGRIRDRHPRRALYHREAELQGSRVPVDVRGRQRVRRGRLFHGRRAGDRAAGHGRIGRRGIGQAGRQFRRRRRVAQRAVPALGRGQSQRRDRDVQIVLLRLDRRPAEGRPRVRIARGERRERRHPRRAHLPRRFRRVRDLLPPPACVMQQQEPSPGRCRA